MMPPRRLFSPRPWPLPSLCGQSRPRRLVCARLASTSTNGAEFQKTQKLALKNRITAEPTFSPDGEWEVTCGLEIHAQLNTTRKLFSDAKTSTTAPPNSFISPIDAALPGTQPTLNPRIILPALRASIALGCTPQPISRFDRKHYFYWDQPAGYQITQFYEPLAKDGSITLSKMADGVDLTLAIRQVQIEQDTGKTIAAPPNSLVDLNRVGTPLVEIITDPFPLDKAETAARVMAKIQAVLKAVDACVLGMEWGGLRADVNISVRKRGDPELGQRCEIKNLSSFKTVTDAIKSEAKRQIDVLEAGEVVEGETRGWDAGYSTTRRLRGKEGEVDYRFMPEPDLPPIVLSERLIQHIRKTLPALPDQLVRMLTGSKYLMTEKDAHTLLGFDDGRSARADSVLVYYMGTVKRVNETLTADGIDITGVGMAVGNWIVHEVGGLLAANELTWSTNPIHEERLGDLVYLVISEKITKSTAKALLPRLLATVEMPSDIVARESLGVSKMDDEELEAVLAKGFESPQGKTTLDTLGGLGESPKEVKKRKALMGYFVGYVMQNTGGKVKVAQIEKVLVPMLASALKKP